MPHPPGRPEGGTGCEISSIGRCAAIARRSAAGPVDQRPDVRDRARILRDADLAEDALQSALITAGASSRGSATRTASKAWVRRLLVHACYAEARRRRAWSANVRVLPVDGPAGPDDILSDPRPRRARPGVPTPVGRARAVFVLHHHLGLPLAEIAETLGIPAGTARSRLHYATRLLRSAIEADAAPVIPEGRMA